MQYAHKYKPKSSSEVIGQKAQIEDIKKKVKDFKPGKKSALLVYGPTGTGKTSAIHALAKELGLEIVEVNASDVRNTESLERVLLPALQQQSLFNTGKIILIDEIDGLSGTGDRGGLSTIVKFIENSHYPIILTANDIWDYKYNALKKVCTLVEFKAINFLDTLKVLKEICEKENITYDEDALNSLARSSGGDLRAVINDLQSLSNSPISKEDVLTLSGREREENIVNALLKIFKTKTAEIALSAFENVDEDIDKLFLWIDENVSKEYTKISDLANAYENLSLADVYYGRIRRWQYYRFYVYIYNLLTAGIALSKEEKYTNFTQYGPTSRILKIWMANQKNARNKAVAAKISTKTHTSKKRVMENIHYLKIMLKDKELGEKLTREFNLEEEMKT